MQVIKNDTTAGAIQKFSTLPRGHAFVLSADNAVLAIKLGDDAYRVLAPNGVVDLEPGDDLDVIDVDGGCTITYDP